jgi:hypothetical protein
VSLRHECPATKDYLKKIDGGFADEIVMNNDSFLGKELATKLGLDYKQFSETIFPEAAFVSRPEDPTKKDRVIVDERGRNWNSTRSERMCLSSPAIFTELGMLMSLDITEAEYADWESIFTDSAREHQLFVEYMKKAKRWRTADKKSLEESAMQFLKEPFGAEARKVWKLNNQGISIGKSDFSDYYGSLPVEDPDGAIICFWSEKQQRVRYVRSYSCTFGNTHSPYFGSRLSRALRSVVVGAFLIPLMEFYDDSCFYEPDASVAHALEIVREVYGLFQNVAEHKTLSGKVLDVLGVVFDTTEQGILEARPKESIRERLHEAADRLLSLDDQPLATTTIRDLQVVAGLATWMQLACRYTGGKHLWSKLYRFMSSAADKADCPIGAFLRKKKVVPALAPKTVAAELRMAQADLAEALKSIRDLARSMPPMRLNAGMYAAPRVHLYTDASLFALGAVLLIMGGEKKPEIKAFAVDVDAGLKTATLREGKQEIVRYETLVVLYALENFASEVRGRRLQIHVDNKWASASLIDGYSPRDAFVSQIAHRVHRKLIALRCTACFYYVNTHFNISDSFSRLKGRIGPLFADWKKAVLSAVKKPLFKW